MSRTSVQNALPLVGVVGVLGALLPDLDESWKASRDDPEHRTILRAGEASYLGFAFMLASLAGYAYGEAAPFVVIMGVAVGIVAMHELALRSDATQRRPAGWG